MTATSTYEGIADVACRWLEVDPDFETRVETEQILTSGGLELNDRFGSWLTFGTAGIRGQRGAGPMRMNRVLVRSVSAAVAERVSNSVDHRKPLIVVGFDARYQSETFAIDTARVLAARDVKCIVLSRPLPTPVLAYAVRELNADAGVMITASHNPAVDSGYKLYWSDGAQIIPPIDSDILSLINSNDLLSDADLAQSDNPLISYVSDEIVDRYLNMASSVVSANGPRKVETVYTALHGVGSSTLLSAFQRTGFDAPIMVASQEHPDPDFPTVEFPNPEENGVLDEAFSLASRKEADLVLANDPDADRLAVAVPDNNVWRKLTGDEVGCLLAEYLLTRDSGGDRLVVTSVVSSRLLAQIASYHGVHYVETLTGFKWIVRPGIDSQSHRFVFGYEEALGYSVSEQVRDKDGITAALVFSELAASLLADGRTVCDLLNDLWIRHGVHRTGLVTQRFEHSWTEDRIKTVMKNLRGDLPTVLSDRSVNSVIDLKRSETGLPPTDALVFEVDKGRVVVRPSGTEAMVKAYVEVVEPVVEGALSVAKQNADRELSKISKSVIRLLNDRWGQ